MLTIPMDIEQNCRILLTKQPLTIKTYCVDLNVFFEVVILVLITRDCLRGIVKVIKIYVILFKAVFLITYIMQFDGISFKFTSLIKQSSSKMKNNPPKILNKIKPKEKQMDSQLRSRSVRKEDNFVSCITPRLILELFMIKHVLEIFILKRKLTSELTKFSDPSQLAAPSLLPKCSRATYFHGTLQPF